MQKDEKETKFRALFHTKAGLVLSPCGSKQQDTEYDLIWELTWEAVCGTSITQTVGQQRIYYETVPKCSLIQRANLPLGSEIVNSCLW